MVATFICKNTKIEYCFNSPTLISELFLKAGISYPFLCDEKGICGKCKVKATGKLSPVTESEKSLLSEKEIKQGVRLACCTFALSSLTIDYNTEIVKHQAFLDNIFKNFSQNKKYHLAYDIGTTTLEFCITDICSHKKQHITIPNPQSQFGDNIISRIEYENNNGSVELQKCLREPFEYILKNLNVEKCVVTGNTTMLHFFNKISAKEMASYPFKPKDKFGYEKENIYYPPCVSAFIGADTVCGAFDIDIQSCENTLFVDIGTNGEIMYFNNGKIKCCSVAAGPAFEGFSVRNGASARDGAIEKVYIENNKICYKTVNNEKPFAITGSGIIDLISCLLDKNILKKDGFLKDKYYFDNSDIFISPEDVRNIQLAKAAVKAGIDILCKDGAKKIYIAGNFGNHLDIDNCIKIGLFPEYFKGRAEFVGNASLNGACKLLDEENREKINSIVSICETVEFAGTEEFSKKFIESMNF